jgi:hypothetical protein
VSHIPHWFCYVWNKTAFIRKKDDVYNLFLFPVMQNANLRPNTDKEQRAGSK